MVVVVPNIAGEFKAAMEVAMVKANEILRARLLEQGKSEGWYTNRSGMLNSAIVVEGSLKTGLFLTIKDNVAKHGKYIHDGTKYITADPFIKRTFDNNRDFIEKIVNEAVAEAVAKVNGGV
jgi:hypothetical protein